MRLVGGILGTRLAGGILTWPGNEASWRILTWPGNEASWRDSGNEASWRGF